MPISFSNKRRNNIFRDALSLSFAGLQSIGSADERYHKNAFKAALSYSVKPPEPKNTAKLFGTLYDEEYKRLKAAEAAKL